MPQSSRNASDTISGSLSADGTHLTAHQVITDHWPDADVVTMLDWTATDAAAQDLASAFGRVV